MANSNKALRGMSVREYALRRGVSPPAVYQAVKRGVAVRFDDGSIDVETTNHLWGGFIDRDNSPEPDLQNPLDVIIARTLDPTYSPTYEPAYGAGSSPGSSPGSPEGEGEIIQEGNSPAAVFNAERARHERAKRELAEVKLEERRGDLVGRKEAGLIWFGLLRRLRDNLRSIPARNAALLAAETDPKLIRARLEAEIDGALRMVDSDEAPIPKA